MTLSKGHKEKDKQLGMSHANATTKLKKRLLFHYVKKCGENFCFVCGKEIKRYKDFTLEHKIPWLHNGPELFWSFDNIAFSHRACNKPNRPRRGFTKEEQAKALATRIRNGLCRPTHNKKGQYWCWSCKSYRDAKHFNRNKRNKHRDGLAGECRKCRAEYRRKAK